MVGLRLRTFRCAYDVTQARANDEITSNVASGNAAVVVLVGPQLQASLKNLRGPTDLTGSRENLGKGLFPKFF